MRMGAFELVTGDVALSFDFPMSHRPHHRPIRMIAASAFDPPKQRSDEIRAAIA